MWPELSRPLLHCAALLAALGASPALAQTAPKGGDVVVRVGPGLVDFDSSATFAVLGNEVPGANIATGTNVTGTIEVEYRLSPQFSLSLTAGIPPESHIDGAGTLAPVGRLADVRYGLGAALAKFTPLGGSFRPFVGAGVGHFTALNVDDGAIANLAVDSSWGPAIQAGADIMISDRTGLYVSVAKAFMDTKATGTFGGAPATADIKLDPLVAQAGLVIRL